MASVDPRALLSPAPCTPPQGGSPLLPLPWSRLSGRPRRVGLALTLASALAAPAASAQEDAPPSIVPKGVSTQGFDPAAAGDRFLAIPDAAPREVEGLALLALANYARGPLRVQGAGDVKSTSLTADQLYLHGGASFSPTPRLLAAVDVPFALVQKGDRNTTLAEPGGGKFGDVKLSARLSAVGQPGDALNLGLQVDVWLPTGSSTDLTGEGSLRFAPRLLVGGRSGSLVYGLQAGGVVRRRFEYGTSAFGPSLTFGAAAGVLLANDRLQIGPEIYGGTVIPQRTSRADLFGSYSTPIEALFGASYRAGSVGIRGAFGPGFTSAPGTAEWRGLVGLSYVPARSPEVPDSDGDGVRDDVDACPGRPGVASADRRQNGCPAALDRDGDGIADAKDACPAVPGVPDADPAKNGCPADRDGDTVVDAKDACPDVAGRSSDDPAKNGCPADGDGDGIPDAKDACPAVPGEASDDPAKNGCPADRDGDTVVDAKDACPDVAGHPSDDPKSNGCPSLARIVGNEIRISEQVHFETGKARILPASDPLLEEVAAIFRQSATIELVTVEGHTDNVGNAQRNKLLSRQRADAVKAWLITRGGVLPRRLLSTGWGQERPLTSNASEAGRASNRRVEFHIVKGRPGEAAGAAGAEAPAAATKAAEPTPSNAKPAEPAPSAAKPAAPAAEAKAAEPKKPAAEPVAEGG